MCRLPRFLIVLLTLLPAMVGQKKPVTLEALRAAPAGPAMMAGAPVWSPQGGRFLYREGTKVRLYASAGRERKDLFDTADLRKQAVAVPPEPRMDWENRRVQEARLQWSQDGKQVLVLESGDLFVWSEDSGKVEQLTATPVAERDPKLSPDGKRVSFRRGNDLYVLEVAAKKTVRLTHDGSETLWNGRLDWVYPEELDLGTAHWWSPDSGQIAYLQFDVSRETLYPHIDALPVQAVGEPQRYPKAGTPNADVRVGVVAAAGGLTKWMDYGETRDFLIARVHWSPRGEVVVHRMNRVQDRLDILAADAKTGQSRLLLRETDPHWINLTDDFRFLQDGRMLRSSEKNGGFRHLYVVQDGRETQLTRGEWEVTSIACVDEQGKRVFYVSSEPSPLERHLYVVGFDGGGKRQLTQGKGTHTVSMSPACDAWLDTHSSLETPSKATLRDAQGAEIELWRPPNTKAQDEYEILKTEIHQFKGPDGTHFYGRLIKPAQFDPAKKYPVIVQVYGGPHAQSVRDSYPGMGLDQVYAHRGFVVWQMDNRGSAGRGHGFETPLYRRLGKVELEDQKVGVKYLLSLGFADPERIGVSGWSYGGYMTLYCLLHAPEVFRAGIAGASVTDWRNYDTIYTERYLGLPAENETGYKESSPVHAAANLKGQLLLVHNLEDDNVLFANALQMSHALQEAGKHFEMVVYPQKSHGVTGTARHHLNEKMVEFFERALKAPKVESSR
jgi:dipeptidyl-peptidase-4